MSSRLSPDVRGPLARSTVLQRVIYGLLIGLLIGSAVLGTTSVIEGRQDTFKLVTFVYLGIVLVDMWVVYLLVAYGEMRPKRRGEEYDGELIAVLVPIFNEDPDLLRRSLDSVIAAEGNTRIVLIDDGSTNEAPAVMDAYAERYDLTLLRLPENAGKRQALKVSVDRLEPDVEFVVTIDSDTVLDPAALVEIVGSLKADGVGACTGDVRLLNERRNILTRMVGAYYWIGLNVYKQALSSIGSVSCCSGCIAAYRAPLLHSVIDEFARQEFLGERCTHSEDRHLTNLVLRQGWKVLYVPEAISYTLTPHTVRGFVRQQLRWKRGYVRESIYTLTYAWRNHRVLFCQILFWDLTAPLATLAFRMTTVATLALDRHFFLSTILPSWVILTTVRYGLLLVMRAPRKLPGMFVYALFYELVLYAVGLWAFFTVKDARWLSRGHSSSPCLPVASQGASVI